VFYVIVDVCAFDTYNKVTYLLIYCPSLYCAVKWSDVRRVTFCMDAPEGPR